MTSIHRTVLLKETIDGLNLNPNSIVLDCTFGGGGHSKELLLKYPNIKVIALDQDNTAWKKAKEKFKGLENRITFINANFRDLNKAFKKDSLIFFSVPPSLSRSKNIKESFLKEKVNGIIFDLGLSSDQLENSGRGFSFMKNEPLLMTMKENPRPEDLTALDIVNAWSEKNLANIIYGYGEEKFSKRIAREIVEMRKNKKIETSFDLIEAIEKAIPAKFRNKRLHCATKTFQALRIAVNDELRALSEGLEKGFNVLKKRGRMLVISFHSLEDRIVKKFYSAKGRRENKIANIITKKPIRASAEEIKNNPRSRSAKLRILEKI